MNYHDSERMSGMLDKMGLIETPSPKDADVLLVNTCAVREKPERKLYGELGNYKRYKHNNPNIIIGVVGCMAPRDPDKIHAASPIVDFLLGPRSIYRLPEILNSISQERQKIDQISIEDDPTQLTPVKRLHPVTAWIDIQFGCNYACSYCAVPSARGREVSRPPLEILAELQDAVNQGYKEIMLLGQTVNGYGRDRKYSFSPEESGESSSVRYDFARLLEEIDSRFPQIRLRYTSPHPSLFSNHLIETMGRLGVVCENIHLPIQSGDDEVLKRMRRGYTYQKFKEIAHKLREVTPDISITTDIIVGFCGETEEQFQNTLRAIEEIAFDQAFMFAYSPRRYTEALNFADEVPEAVKKRRLQELIELANNQFHVKNEALLGRELEVLVEGVSAKNAERMSGRTRTNKTVIFDGVGKCSSGDLVTVQAEEAFLWGVKGSLVTQERPILVLESK